MNTIVHVNLVLKSLVFFPFKTKFQLISSFSFSSVLTNTFTHFTLSFILFELLLFDVFFCFSCEIPSAQDVTAAVAATLLLLMLWFTRCCYVVVASLFKMHSGILWKRNTIMGLYRTVDEHVLFGLFFNCTHMLTISNSIATAINRWWSKLVSLVILFFRILFSRYRNVFGMKFWTKFRN